VKLCDWSLITALLLTLRWHDPGVFAAVPSPVTRCFRAQPLGTACARARRLQFSFLRSSLTEPDGASGRRWS